ncbi:MAG: hypothetical protein P4L40_12950 [Terracidiphilus sp.]|nr:hypothetical protein [Terracidiphilus sp.]
MQITRFVAAATLAAAFLAPVCAQTPTPGYHTVACFKVKPDMGAAFRKYAADEVHKIAQGRVDSGEISTFYLLRAVFPQGQASECDYLAVAMFPGMPHLLGPEELSAAIKKSGLSITPEDYVNHRNAVATLVSAEVFQNQAFVGHANKGDYFQINYMRVSDASTGDYINWEKKIWQPLAEAYLKDGKRTGWSLNLRVMPSGSDLPYQAVTVDIFSSLDAVFADDTQFYDRFKKAHPDMELGTTFEQYEKLRARALVKLFVLEDLVTASK